MARKLSASEFNTAMVHFYRGEVQRSNTWRSRLDNTTYWAVITAGATLSFAEARSRLEGEGKPVLLVFGTGWGLASSVVTGADALLEPIHAVRGDYNHLSVRSACV